MVGSFIKKELLMPFFAKLPWVTDKTFSETGDLAAIINFLSNFAGGFIASLFSFLVVLAIYALTVMLSLRAMLELLLLEKIKKHCLKHYPTISSEVKTNFRGDLRNIAGSLTWLIIGGATCLIIPFFGPFLLFFLASYLNFRGLCDDAMEGLADTPKTRKIIQENRLTMTLLGASLSIFIFIPFIGFFAPGVMGSAACHFCMRRVKDLASPPNPDAAETD
jgi:uncharacterized protein involved in cysteine biosynthesis